MTALFNLENTYNRLPERFHSRQSPTPILKPELYVFNDALKEELGISWSSADRQEWVQILSGNQEVQNGSYLAQAYAGHQFGHFTMLGDGRAILIGEHTTPGGKKVDIQLKGAGQTPYSRRGDGRATFYSMLREYLISEAMHYLNIPTSRSLAVVKSPSPVYREQVQVSGILTRVASSHIRVGTVEYARQYGLQDDLKQLADYIIDRHYPDIKESEDSILELVKKIMESQIDLIVNWIRVGFIHGVMNTDNMSLAGETIDYGPCAFMNQYDPDTVFSSIDHQGRYSYGNQPRIGHWNLSVLASALAELVKGASEVRTEKMQAVLNKYPSLFKSKYYEMMFHKIGVRIDSTENTNLVDDLLKIMYEQKLDYTDTFRRLTYDLWEEENILPDILTWKNKWKTSYEKEGTFAKAQSRMSQVNPVSIPRNHWVENVLSDAVNGNDAPFMQALEILKDPYNIEGFDSELQNAPVNFDKEYQTFCGT